MNEITALIRYKDSAKTLPDVLTGLKKQRQPVDCILAVDTGSRDGSTRILEDAGAQIVRWEEPYHHSKVLNFGLSRCATPYVLLLSSHTVMNEDSTVKRLYQSLDDPDVAACSICWDDDTYYSNAIDQAEITEKGVKFGSIYTNSLGLIRRARWVDYPFEESINGVEDYEWALHQIQAGHSVTRIKADISYQRSAHNRVFRATARVFYIANRHGLAVKWFGRKATTVELLRHLVGKLQGEPEAVETFDHHARRLGGSLFWRFTNLNIN